MNQKEQTVDPEFEAIKRKILAHLDSLMEDEEKKTVELKKEPVVMVLRIFNDTEGYENQIMRECEAFYRKHGVYPNAIVANPETFDMWENQICATFTDDDLFSDLEDDIGIDFPSCEIGPSNDGTATMFRTDDYELFLLENPEYQVGVYQLLNGYSPILENGRFSYPIVDMVATGQKIRSLLSEKGISPVQVQEICGLCSVQAVYKWFKGSSVPKIDHLGILSNLLNTPIDDLVVFTTRIEP